MEINSTRGQEWLSFAMRVADHIENYTVKQYGDKPDDQIENWTPEQCVMQIGKYVARFGSNQRGEEEKTLDMKKIAHYAQLVHSKLMNGG